MAFAEAGFEVIANLSLGMKRASACNQNFFRFDVIGIRYTAIHRANRGASLKIMEADAFGAKLRIDDKDGFTLRDRIVGALGLACAAVDTLIGNHRSHDIGPPECSGIKLE